MAKQYIEMQYGLGEPSKLKSPETWEKFPTGGGGVIENSKSSQVSVGKSSKRGGVITFQKSPKFPKVPKFEK